MGMKDNLASTTRILLLRDRYIKGDKLTPQRDVKIWIMEIKALASDVKHALEKVTVLIKQLTHLREKCIRTGDDLSNTLLRIKKGLFKKIEAKKIKIKDLEK